MTEKTVKPWVKPVLEMGPVVLFFVAYTRIKDREFTILGETYEGFIVATALFIPVLLLSTLILYMLTGKLSKMQIFTALLVVVFGGLGIWFNDERFFKMKPTMIYIFVRRHPWLWIVEGAVIPENGSGWGDATY